MPHCRIKSANEIPEYTIQAASVCSNAQNLMQLDM